MGNSASGDIITITGDLGAGKSLLSKVLLKEFNAEYYSTGAAQRQIAQEMAISTLELNQLAEKEKWVDEKIDSVFKDLAKTETNLVVDSRMAWFFLPTSFKIRLEVHEDIAAQRIIEDKTRNGESYKSLEDTKTGLIKRKSSECERFKTYYGVDIADHENYNLVIDTSGAQPEDIAKIAVRAAKDFFENPVNASRAIWCTDTQGHLVQVSGKG